MTCIPGTPLSFNFHLLFTQLYSLDSNGISNIYTHCWLLSWAFQASNQPKFYGVGINILWMAMGLRVVLMWVVQVQAWLLLSLLLATTQPAATFTTQLLLLPQLWPMPMELKTQGANASMDKDRESRHVGPSHVGKLEEVKEWRQSLEGRLLDAHACKTSPPWIGLVEVDHERGSFCLVSVSS